MVLGDVIKMLRAQNKLSQRALASRLGVSHGAVAQWESGTAVPTIEHMQAISEVLGFALKGPLQPSRPYQGEFVDDPDELALLRFWRKLVDSQRTIFLGVLKAAALPPDDNNK